jgi:hypothetical protein
MVPMVAAIGGCWASSVLCILSEWREKILHVEASIYYHMLALPTKVANLVLAKSGTAFLLNFRLALGFGLATVSFHLCTLHIGGLTRPCHMLDWVHL